MSEEVNDLVPRLTRTTTAYHFLREDLVAVIREEPKRMRMYTWTSSKEQGGYYRPEIYPACGTIGCIGGWTEMMIVRKMNGWGNDAAYKLLGITAEQSDELFMPNVLVHAPRQGTAEHVEEVVAHIMAFTDKYKDQLMAHVVQPPPMETPDADPA